MSIKSSQVVVAFDFSASGRTALDRGLELAERAPSHVLHVVCVLDPSVPMTGIAAPEGVDYRYAAKVQDMLAAELEQRLQARAIAGRVHFFVHARIGKAGDEILMLAREVGADLIVIGSNGLHGMERVVLGSVSEQVVRGAGCTVEVARPKAYPDVALLPMVEVEPHLGYVPPHRYFFEDNRVNQRPADWPLY